MIKIILIIYTKKKLITVCITKFMIFRWASHLIRMVSSRDNFTILTEKLCVRER